MFKSTGQLKYFNRWLIIVVDKDICKYYSKLINYYSKPIKLHPSKDGPHITVIAGKYETIVNQIYWKKYDGNPIEFEYKNEIDTDGNYFWLPVQCTRIEDIRIELGLPPVTPIPWHLTIGNLNEK